MVWGGWGEEGWVEVEGRIENRVVSQDFIKKGCISYLSQDVNGG